MSEAICEICKDPVKNRALIWCFHAFCYSCLEKWFKLKNECPVCRNPFCIICGLNPKGKEYNKCHCDYEHKNATVCNFCGEWAPEHGDEQNCPKRPSLPLMIEYLITRSREFPRLNVEENNSDDEESSENEMPQLIPDPPIRVVFDSKNISSEPSNTNAEEGRTQIEPDSTQIEPDSSQIEPDSAQIEPGSAQIEPGSAQIEPGSAQIEQGSSRGNNISHIRVMPEVNIQYSDIRDLENVLRLFR